MNGRVLIMILAVVVAIAILCLTLWIPERSSSDSRSSIVLPDGSQLPPGFDVESASSPIPSLTAPATVRTEYHFEHQDRMIDVSGATLTPRPNWISEVDRPDVRIHMGDGQLVRVTAIEGTFVTPNNQLHSVRFAGDVEISIYQDSKGRSMDLTPHSGERMLRVNLDDAQFDLERGQIQSDGPVVVTGDRITFQGHGLRVTFNEKRRRVDHLEIKHGQQMALHLGSGPAVADVQSTLAGPNGTAREVDGASVEVPQFYLARFSNDVRITDRRMDLSGDQLDLVFSLDAGFQSQQIATPIAVPPRSDRTSIGDRATISASRMSQMDEQIITVAWSGRLVVEPQDDPPSDLAGPEDVLAILEGRPVRLVTSEEEFATASRADYLFSSGRLRMTGSEAYPMKLDKPELGVLEGARLEINPESGVGVVFGPGSFLAHGHPSLVDRLEHAPVGAVTPEMAMQWQDQMDLSFAPRTTAALSSGPALIRELRQVDIRGDVRVADPAFHLDSEVLTLHFAETAGGPPGLQHIVAVGDVKVDTAPTGQQQPMWISSNRFQIDLEPKGASDGEMDLHPTRLTATGSVLLREPGRTLRTGELVILFAQSGQQVSNVAHAVAGGGAASRLEVDPGKAEKDEANDDWLVPFPAVTTAAPVDIVGMDLLSPTPTIVAERNREPNATSAIGPEASTTAGSHPSLKSITALEGVQIDVADPPVRIRAEQMIADAQFREADLYGTDLQWVQIERESGFLEGPHLRLIDQEAKRIEGIGPGRAQFLGRDLSMAPQSQVSHHPDRWMVTWRDGMSYDHAIGHAKFVGDVGVKGVSGNTTCSFTANALRMAFEVEHDEETNVAVREVKVIYASGDVVFLAEKFAPILDTGSEEVGERTLETAIRISGPVLDYDNQSQQIHVLGDGTMLLRDHRKGTRLPSDDRLDPKVAFMGGGDTVFSFNRKLVLDAKDNDLTMSDRVTMIRQSHGSKEIVQMDCGRLIADFESTGGVAVWLSGEAPQPNIIAVRADRNVMVSRGERSIHAAHLIYDGPARLITLKPDPGGRVQLIDPQQSLPVKILYWDLIKDEFRFEGPGAGRVPIRR